MARAPTATIESKVFGISVYFRQHHIFILKKCHRKSRTAKKCTSFAGEISADLTNGMTLSGPKLTIFGGPTFAFLLSYFCIIKLINGVSG